jgi:hypothetical protein
MKVEKAIEVLRSNGYAVDVYMVFNEFRCANVRSPKWPKTVLVRLWHDCCEGINVWGKDFNDEIRRIEGLADDVYHENDIAIKFALKGGDSHGYDRTVN